METTSPYQSNRFMFGFLLYLIAAQFGVSLLLFAFDGGMTTAAIQILFYAIAFFPPVVLCFVCAPKSFLRMPFRRLALWDVVLVVLISFAVMPVMLMLSAVSMLFAPNDVGEMVTKMAAESNPWLNLIAIGVLPAVLEELIFRGIILRGYRGVRLTTAALCNGVFFAAMHLNYQQMLYAFALGFLFVLLVHYTGSIYASVLAHFTINGTQMLLAMAASEAPEAAEATAAITVGEMVSLMMVGAVFLWITVGLVLLLIRRSKKDIGSFFGDVYTAGPAYPDGGDAVLPEDGVTADGNLALPEDCVTADGNAALPEKMGDGYLTHAVIPAAPRNKILNWPFWAVVATFFSWEWVLGFLALILGTLFALGR